MDVKPGYDDSLGSFHGPETPTRPLTVLEEKRYQEALSFINAGGDLRWLKSEQLRAYLRKHGLRACGLKYEMVKRVEDHLELKEGGGRLKYPLESFVIDCTGHICAGDVILFQQKVYEKFLTRPSNLPPLGKRTVVARVIKVSRDSSKGAHLFTLMKHVNTILELPFSSDGLPCFPESGGAPLQFFYSFKYLRGFLCPRGYCKHRGPIKVVWVFDQMEVLWSSGMRPLPPLFTLVLSADCLGETCKQLRSSEENIDNVPDSIYKEPDVIVRGSDKADNKHLNHVMDFACKQSRISEDENSKIIVIEDDDDDDELI